MGVVMAVSALALVLAGALIIISQMAAFRKNMALDLVLQADMIANNSLAAVSFHDQDDAALVLGTLSSRGAIAYAVVKKADETVLATFRRAGFDATPESFTGDGEYLFCNGWLLARQPIVLDGSAIGTVFLQADLRELVAFSRQIIKIVGASLLVVFLMAWGLSFKLQKRISGPIERLTEMVRDVSRQRDFSIRATQIGKDEIGVLAKAFNEMLSEVELRDVKLREREKRAQDYLNVAGVMIVAFDPQGKVTLINPKGREILGMEETDVVGRNWVANCVPSRIRARAKDAFERFVSGIGGDVQHYENMIVTSGGKERLIPQVRLPCPLMPLRSRGLDASSLLMMSRGNASWPAVAWPVLAIRLASPKMDMPPSRSLPMRRRTTMPLLMTWSCWT